jgi:hypothetical protein
MRHGNDDVFTRLVEFVVRNRKWWLVVAAAIGLLAIWTFDMEVF